MTKRATLMVRVLATVAAVGLLGACGGGGKLATRQNATTSTTEPVGVTTSNPAPAPGATAVTAGPTTTAASSTQASDRTGSPPSSGAAAKPPAGTGGAPQAGNYKYQSTDEKGDVTQLNLQVKTDRSSGSVYDQTLTISSPQGSEQNAYTWNPASGVTVSSTTLSGEQGSITCNWKPGISQYVLPIHDGASWSSVSNCSTSLAGAPATASYTNKATVEGSQQIQVAGETLDTWVIHRTTVFKAKSATFDLTITTVGVEYFAPSDGETPKETTDTTTSGSYGGRNFSQETKATIEALTLKPTP